MMIPINWENNVDVQRALHFDLDPSMDAGQGHKILWFCEFIGEIGRVVSEENMLKTEAPLNEQKTHSPSNVVLLELVFNDAIVTQGNS